MLISLIWQNINMANHHYISYFTLAGQSRCAYTKLEEQSYSAVTPVLLRNLTLYVIAKLRLKAFLSSDHVFRDVYAEVTDVTTE